MQQIDIPQGTQEWLQQRLGIITASNMHKVLTGGKGKTRRSYMNQLIGEIMSGEPAESFSNAYIERGHALEPEARTLYEIESGNTVVETGFISTGFKEWRIGYSPDGLVGDDGLIEIKTKTAALQVEVLRNQVVPAEHIAQIQTGLFVTGRKWLDFISFCPMLPIFIKRVFTEEEYIRKKIMVESLVFYQEMYAVMEGIKNV